MPTPSPAGSYIEDIQRGPPPPPNGARLNRVCRLSCQSRQSRRSQQSRQSRLGRLSWLRQQGRYSRLGRLRRHSQPRRLSRLCRQCALCTQSRHVTGVPGLWIHTIHWGNPMETVHGNSSWEQFIGIRQHRPSPMHRAPDPTSHLDKHGSAFILQQLAR